MDQRIDQKEKQKILWDKWNGDRTYQNLCDTTNIVLGGKFITINAYVKKEERSQINRLIFHPKTLEKDKSDVNKMAQ